MSFDPESWSQFLDKLPGALPAVVLSIFIAFLRIVYDAEETKVSRIILEAALCGALTYTAWAAVMALGLNVHWAVVAGGIIGWLGATTARMFALKLLKARFK